MRKRDMLQNAANLAISTTKQYSTKPNSLKDYARNKNIVKKQKNTRKNTETSKSRKKISRLSRNK